MNFIKRLFSQPTADELAVRDLAEAKRQQLAVLAAREHYIKVAECLEIRIERLEAYVRSQAK